ncbi:hypothetical protein BFR04_05655 [Gaetbulibacter sp. 4G1]|nr:hypothetical protein [Gaetbulibacter sp. 4G1]PIA79006.1 hypothetical protein BFR04_05655 [Gaetbulibacter sp. 4G1]
MSKDLPQSNPSEEVDLGQLFKLIGNMFERLFKFIGSIFNKLFLAFVWCVFFLKKHFVKFVIAGVVGIALGILQEKSAKPVYKSYIVVKQNYYTGESLNKSIGYYNTLINQGNIDLLKNMLNIKGLDASSILGFELESAVTENEKLKAFDYYLSTLDSTLASKVDYETYIDNSKDYNFKLQKIVIKSNRSENYINVFEKIIESINSNEYFKREQAKDLKQLRSDSIFIENSLRKSDTLLAVYKEAIIKSAERNNDFQGKIMIEGRDNVSSSTKEFELYNKTIELREKLVKIGRQIDDNKHIIEVMSSKQNIGTIDNRKEFLGKLLNIKILYALFLVMLTFIFLLGISLVKFLERYKDKV